MQNDSELDAESLGVSLSSLGKRRQRKKNLTLSFTNFIDDFGINLENINNNSNSEIKSINRVEADIIRDDPPYSVNSSSLDSSSNYTKFSTSLLNTEDNVVKVEKAQKARDIYKNIIEAETSNDNDYEINECFTKLQIQELTTCFFTFVCMMSVYLYYDVKNNTKFKNKNPNLYKLEVNFSLVISSISVICFIISTIIRYKEMLKLDKSISNVMKKTSFWNFDYFGSFLIEVFIALLHPNILTKGIKFKTKTSWYGYDTEYDVNDIFCILTLIRVYVIFRYAISITIFYNYRALRLARTLGIDMSRIFAVKCYILYEPFKFLTVFGSILIMLLSFAVKVTETPIYSVDMGLNDYRSIINCIWNILVTMTTAGYGDMYPQTGLGKIIIVIVSLLGSIVVSLLTVSLQDLFGFAYYEESAFNAKHNNIINNNINEKAGKLFLRSMMYHVALKKAKNKNMKNKDRKKYYKMSQEYLDDKRDSEKIFQETIQFNRNTYQILSESELLGQRLDYFLDGLNETTRNSYSLNDLVSGIEKSFE